MRFVVRFYRIQEESEFYKFNVDSRLKGTVACDF